MGPSIPTQDSPKCLHGPSYSRLLNAPLRLPWVPPPVCVCPRCPHPHNPVRLTGADDFLDVDPGSLNLSGETAARPAWLLIGVGFCIELGLRDLPQGVVQGQEDRWRR